MAKKITPKTKFSKIVGDEKSAEILMESGMHCFGCPMAQMETIEEGCLAHGMSKKEVDKLIEKLNKGKGK
jgi:hybrid cluster-associated redox disulfide protein